MTIIHRRLASAQLEATVSDPADRNTLPMSTLIGIDAEPPNYQWLLETTWDGSSIGDIHIFRNLSCNPNGQMIDPKKKNEWIWWGGVPRGKVKAYRFAADDVPVPETGGKYAQRKAESTKAPQSAA